MEGMVLAIHICLVLKNGLRPNRNTCDTFVTNIDTDATLGTSKLINPLDRFLLQITMVKMSPQRFGPVAGLVTLLSLVTMAAAQDMTYCASFNTADGDGSKLSLAWKPPGKM